MELVVGGSVINGAYPSSFDYNCVIYKQTCYKVHFCRLIKLVLCDFFSSIYFPNISTLEALSETDQFEVVDNILPLSLSFVTWHEILIIDHHPRTPEVLAQVEPGLEPLNTGDGDGDGDDDSNDSDVQAPL